MHMPFWIHVRRMNIWKEKMQFFHRYHCDFLYPILLGVWYKTIEFITFCIDKWLVRVQVAGAAVPEFPQPTGRFCGFCLLPLALAITADPPGTRGERVKLNIWTGEVEVNSAHFPGKVVRSKDHHCWSTEFWHLTFYHTWNRQGR